MNPDCYLSSPKILILHLKSSSPHSFLSNFIASFRTYFTFLSDFDYC